MTGLRVIDLDTYEQILAEWQQSEEMDPNPLWDQMIQQLENLSEANKQEKDAAYALELEGLGSILPEELSK